MNVACETWYFKRLYNILFNMIVEMELRVYMYPQISDTMGTGDVSKTSFITKGNALCFERDEYKRSFTCIEFHAFVQVLLLRESVSKFKSLRPQRSY